MSQTFSTNALSEPLLVAGPVTTSGLTMSTATLLGRTTASTGAVEEITIGANLTLAAGVLSGTGGGSGVSLGTAFAFDNFMQIL